MITRFVLLLWAMLFFFEKPMCNPSPKVIVQIGIPHGTTGYSERYIKNRGDMSTSFEPVMTAYSQTLNEHGKEEADKTITNFDEEAIKLVEDVKEDHFMSEYAYALKKGDFVKSFLKKGNHMLFFLLSDPQQATLSCYKQYRKMGCYENKHFEEIMDYGAMKSLYNIAKDSSKRPPFIIDTKKLFDNPEVTIEKLCDALDIVYKADHLKWAQDDTFKKECNTAWQVEFQKSTSFKDFFNEQHSLDDEEVRSEDRNLIEKIIERNKVIYDELKEYSL